MGQDPADTTYKNFQHFLRVVLGSTPCLLLEAQNISKTCGVERISHNVTETPLPGLLPKTRSRMLSAAQSLRTSLFASDPGMPISTKNPTGD